MCQPQTENLGHTSGAGGGSRGAGFNSYVFCIEIASVRLHYSMVAGDRAYLQSVRECWNKSDTTAVTGAKVIQKLIGNHDRTPDLRQPSMAFFLVLCSEKQVSSSYHAENYVNIN